MPDDLTELPVEELIQQMHDDLYDGMAEEVEAEVHELLRRGFQEEIAVCEDLSKGGLSFRSRNQYAEGSRVEVAVPFTPGAGAIFVPIRIVFSQSIPTAGLYRHGAAYIKPPLDV